jgi:prepilin-type N-terminal cleavage/methylation domain-containing protein
MKKTPHAFTLIEILVVIGIIALTAAIVYPIVTSSKEAANRTVCVSNLRQIYQAITLYRLNQDKDGVGYGEMYSMGLPPGLRQIAEEGKIPREVFACRGKKTMIIDPLYAVMWAPEGTVGRPSWAEYVQRKGDGAILLADHNHDLDGSPMGSPFVTHRGVGVYLGGHVKTVVKQGNWLANEWW